MQNKSINGQRIRVRGLVQGVGFRPYVWRLANEAGLAGEVANDAGGVLIKIWGSDQQLSGFVERLEKQAPPLARIDSIECSSLPGDCPDKSFTIVKSTSGSVKTTIIPDAATCDDCRREIFDEGDRRYHYPFTNCTNCGPRLTITHALPYDRANTSMAKFLMCPECQREYEDPADRRFHAQPNACPNCGPSVWLSDKGGSEIALPEGTSAISHAAQLIEQGQIIAIKGLGGFHLACGGAKPWAIRELRLRKKRPDKPLALMVVDLAMAAHYVHLGETARQVLCSAQAPIVLARRAGKGQDLTDELAPGQNRLGIMLPYTPLHHLLMSELDGPIVLTSGNMSDEPQLTDNEEALAKLADVADAWLMHDRDIVNRLDDSVVQLVGGQPQIMRRARGYAPEPFLLPEGFAEAANILAMGGQLKNTFCLLKNGQAIVSQHIGDLENPVAHRDFRANLKLYQRTNQFTPDRIAVDLHPDYFSTRFGQQMANELDCPLDHIQHHHAHIAACLAEHQIALQEPPVVGVVFDGLGYGADDSLWGGEFLLANYNSCKRMAHFLPVALPGGERANLEPWRNSFAHLLAAFKGRGFEQLYGDVDFIKLLQAKPLHQMQQMIERRLNSPTISSAGRLFDAVAAALGVCTERVSFEGQAAILLQALAEKSADETGEYGAGKGPVIDWKPLWSGIFNDLQQKTDPSIIAARFHNTLIQLVARMAASIASDNETNTIVLTGGVFQNARLLSGAKKQLEERGFRVLSPGQFPANDGGLSLGQAIIAAARQIQPDEAG